MSTNIKITAVLTARPNKAEQLEALLLSMLPNCRAEPGNLRWDIWRDSSLHDRVILDELYVDEAAAAAHKETLHYKNYLLQIGELADRSALILRPVAVGD